MTRWLCVCAVAVLGLALLGAPCRPGGFQSIVVDAPLDGLLVDDPGGPFAGAARVGTNFDAVTVEVRLDGIDLVAGLGLTPPFSGASGVLAVGPDVVTVADFSFQFTKPRQIDFQASGLSVGAHSLEVAGEKLQGVSASDLASFEVLAPLSLAAQDLPAAARGPQDAGTEGTVFSSSLGQPLASPPIGLSGGGSLRSGFHEVSEALMGGAP